MEFPRRPLGVLRSRSAPFSLPLGFWKSPVALWKTWSGGIATVFSRTQLGHEGEDIAARYLQRHGFRILTKRYRNRFGEIDIVAIQANVVVFVEVKTWTHSRSLPKSEDPSQAVDLRKQQRLTQAALAFLKQFHLLERPARFDVVSVVGGNGLLQPRVRHFVNAFEPVGFGQFFR